MTKPLQIELSFYFYEFEFSIRFPLFHWYFFLVLFWGFVASQNPSFRSFTYLTCTCYELNTVVSELNLFVTISQSLCTRDLASSVHIFSTSSSLQEIKKYFVRLLLWQTHSKQRLGKWSNNPVFKRAYCRINLSKADFLDGQLQTNVPLSLTKQTNKLDSSIGTMYINILW